jgi:hypothetical protein
MAMSPVLRLFELIKARGLLASLTSGILPAGRTI